ncbi:MAG: hypothetical protein SPK90_04515 [Bacteroidales bacterium]|nr:hypothetical protein [Bacteroidales bacterium]MDY6406633.1 hypothetical protein [Bacteroidales bacterium]
MKKLSIILFALCWSLALWADATASLDDVPCAGSVRITATAKEGYEFVKWEDGNTDNPRIVTNVRLDQSYKAVFKLKEYTLDPTLFGEGVTLNGSSTPITVTMGQEVTALATATDECEEFKNWNDDNTENPRTFTYDGTATPFTVVYGTKLFTVTANAAATEGDITIELIP